jgi:hypothetical protein
MPSAFAAVTIAMATTDTFEVNKYFLFLYQKLELLILNNYCCIGQPGRA